MDISEYLFDNVVLCQLRLQLLSGWHAFADIWTRDKGFNDSICFITIIFKKKPACCSPE